MANVPNKIIVHHSADTSPDDQFFKIDEYHRARGFPKSEIGYFVGYHFVINRLGNVTRARKDEEEGAHTIGENFSSLGICLEGNFDTQMPTEAQEKSLAMLLRGICERYKIPANQIFPHRAFKNTSCYGSGLDKWWAARVYLEHEIARLHATLIWIQTQISEK